MEARTRPIVTFEASPELLRRIDQAAEREGRSRSSFLRHWLDVVTREAAPQDMRAGQYAEATT